eukprot:TRINITY_DN9189_c0_g1_i7.p1 TRINITY_DN9189_c0_g1~~TRINITY_DN9189_c0_g1_i7.p1  ORF type:complete len:414 (+),score=23.63 TRINITY_DN9189_c0_g1_i7:67-1308(+)
MAFDYYDSDKSTDVLALLVNRSSEMFSDEPLEVRSDISTYDPTLQMVDNLHLGLPEFALGLILLSVYTVIQLVAAPINLVRDSTPITYRVVRSQAKSFAPAHRMGYNFRGNYLYPGGGLPRLHYLDEGPAHAHHVLVLLHGMPFWSQSWIKIIPKLTSQNFRVIVPDLIGFGKSDKFTDYRVYNTSMHKASLKGLLDHLGLHQNLVLVGHNWGWMIGAGLAKDYPNLFNKFVILNTNNLPDGELVPQRYRNMAQFTRFAVINAFFLAFNASMNLLRELFPLSLLIKSLNINFTKEEIRAFMSPHLSVSECGGTTAFPLMVPVFPTHPEAREMREIRQFLHRSKKKTLVAYSEASLLPWISQGDFVVGNRLIFYQNLTPETTTTPFRIPNGGHLIMYDRPDVVSQLIINFVLAS